ncbi:hypothetical protein RI367_005935 [Sorochytrium milnesiophthora]
MLQKLIQKLPRELQTYVIALGGVQLCAALQHLPALRMILHWYKEAGHLLSRDAEEWTDICVAAQWSAGLLLLVDSGVRQVTYVKRPREHLVDIILPLDRLQLWRPERSHDGCLAVLLYNVMTTDTTVDHRIAWARLRSQQSVALIAAEVAWRGGGMQDLRAICDRLHLPTDNWSMARYFANAAAGAGNLELLTELRGYAPELVEVDRGLLHTNFDDLSGAVRSGNKRLIQWMHDLNPQRKHDALYSAAAEEGDVLLLEWLAQRFPIDPTDAKHALVLAAAKGNLPAVQWFVTQVDAQVNLDTLQAAVESGNLDLVKYLHSLGTIDAASRTVDEAAAAGRLHIAQWLHEHRQEGCTTLAMYRAARRGDLEMLRWLHEHYAVDCSRKTVHASATEGYMQVVQFLVSECAVQLRDYDLVGAAVSGHLPMLQYLLEQRPQTCLNDAVEAAVRRGHLYVIKFLYQQGHCTLIDAQWPFLKHADEEVKQWFIRHRPDSEAHERASDPNNDTVGDDDDKGSGVVV